MERCGYYYSRPDVKEPNLVKKSVYNQSSTACEDCKDYYCIRHTNRLSNHTYHPHVICRDCREKCYLCEVRYAVQSKNSITEEECSNKEEERENKKLEGYDYCLNCLNYFCKAHSWKNVAAINTYSYGIHQGVRPKLEVPLCPSCAERCYGCHSSFTIVPRQRNGYLCEPCSRSYCATCHPETAAAIHNTFRCSSCTYLYGCILTVHAFNSPTDCTCDKRRMQILGLNYERLPSDLIHPDYEVIATYEVEEEDHDGYCSDHYNDRLTEMTVSERYPLPTCFGPNNVDLSFYRKETSCHGNGYCGLKTTYNLVGLEVVKKNRGVIDRKIRKMKHRRTTSYGWSTDEDKQSLSDKDSDNGDD